MQNSSKYPIMDVYDLLCKRDPEWTKPFMVPKFRTLYDGWRRKELRAGAKTANFYSLAWQRGWLKKADFIRFRDYALQ